MSIEVFPNNYQTQLNGAIDDSTTSVVVDAAPSDVSTGNFRIKVGDEIMKVTSFSGTTLTVARAQEGTSAASHSDNAAVYGVLTAAALLALRGDGITTGALSSAPSASPAGRLYKPSDAPYDILTDGSALTAFGPTHKLTLPVSGDYSWINQGGASVSTSSGGVLLTAPAASAPNLRCRVKSQPSTPYTITAMLTPEIYPSGSDQLAGIGFRESATGKLETLHYLYSSGVGAALLVAAKWTSPTVYVTERTYFKIPDAGFQPRWLRMTHDGTTLAFWYSAGGYSFRKLVEFAKNNFFTTAPDQVVFCAQAAAATYDVAAHLLSWKEE